MYEGPDAGRWTRVAAAVGAQTTFALALGFAGGCGGAVPRPVGATPAVAPADPLPAGPRVPTKGLQLESLAVDWTLPEVVAGHPSALHAHLDRGPVDVLVNPRLLDRFEHARPTTLAAVLAEGAELPLSRIDVPGLPHYAGDVALSSAWLGERDTTTVVIDDAPIDAARWRSLPVAVEGSCASALNTVASARNQALLELQPFVEHADAVLWQVYKRSLDRDLPALARSLRIHAPTPRPEAYVDANMLARRQCGHRYWKRVESLLQCGSPEQCPSAPRMYVVGGARIGSLEPDVFVPDDCADRFGRDVEAEVRGLARQAAEVAVGVLDDRWVVLADRIAVLGELEAALGRVCMPTRRRFDDTAMTEARHRLMAIGKTLSVDAMEQGHGRWLVEPGLFRVPGSGPVTQVAHYLSPRRSVARQARAQVEDFERFVARSAKCTGHRGLPLAVLVVKDRRLSHLGYYYEEQLACPDVASPIPERLPGSEPSASSARLGR